MGLAKRRITKTAQEAGKLAVYSPFPTLLFLKEIKGKECRVFPRPAGGGIHPLSYYCVQK